MAITFSSTPKYTQLPDDDRYDEEKLLPDDCKEDEASLIKSADARNEQTTKRLTVETGLLGFLFSFFFFIVICVVFLGACFFLGWMTGSVLFDLTTGRRWTSKPVPIKSAVQHVPHAPGIFWSPCPDVADMFCSYLSVPLDYADPRGPIVSLALRMVPASAPVKDQLGYMLVNPGGPGGSGHEFVVQRGREISTIVSHRYHVVGFDPRGVNLTSPAHGCFDNQGDASRLQRDFEALGLPGQSKALRGGETRTLQSGTWQIHADAMFKAFDESCRQNGNRDVLETSSTATVARDMRSIIDALGQDKLVYWGFSYGTILGATFSAMFPDLVGRLWLDGVSDSQTYTNDLWQWGRIGMNNSQDVWSGFFSSCAKSGAKGCALAKKGSSAKDIEGRVRDMILKLTDEPVAVGSSKFGPGVVTASQVHYKIWTALYAPKSWPTFAKALADLERGNGTEMYELANANNEQLARTDPSKNAFHRKATASFLGSTTIMCLDTNPSVVSEQADASSMASYAQSLANISPSGYHWAQWIAACRLWTTKAREVYRGPWTVKDGLRKTAKPIVFFSMEFDPVTPYISARKMADGFGRDSATLVLQRDGLGHCSSAHPSLCTAKLIRKYFLDGTVPEYGTECDTDEGFLFPHPDKKWQPKLALAEDAELVDAIYRLGMKGPVGMENLI